MIDTRYRTALPPTFQSTENKANINCGYNYGSGYGYGYTYSNGYGNGYNYGSGYGDNYGYTYNFDYGNGYTATVTENLTFEYCVDKTCNENRYSYAMNNPLVYVDPDGEIAWFVPIIIGAVIGGASYTAQVGFSDGGFDNWNWGQFGKSVGIGAISGAVTAGIGQIFGAVGSMGIGGEIARAYTHGFASGMISEFTGGSFMQGFAAGGLSSLAGSAFMMYGGSFANSTLGTYTFSGLAGGVGAELTGGNFWQGAGIGLMSAGLNHLATIADGAGARYYANRKAAYKDMWDKSFENGVPIRETSAWELENGGTIMLPYDKNELRTSYNNALPVSKIDSNGTRYVKFNGKWYAISGHAHTHPHIDPTGKIGLSTQDIRVYNQIGKPLTILYNKTIYSASHSSRGWVWSNKGTW